MLRRSIDRGWSTRMTTLSRLTAAFLAMLAASLAHAADPKL